MSIKKLIILIIIIGGLGFGAYSYFNEESKKERATEKLFETVNKKQVEITKYIVYGTHLNIEGELDKKLYEDNILDAKLILKDLKNKTQEFDIEYELSNDDKFTFKTSDKINEGIDLEELKNGNFYFFLRITEKELNDEEKKENVEYYSLKNTTDYEDLEYYTITKNEKNNKIEILFGSRVRRGTEIGFMNVVGTETKLPDNVYDIVIDPGHGGKDGGAVATYNGKKYAEKDITLDYAKDLKTALEEVGLKVKLTRDGTNEEELGIYDMYGKGGRAVVPNEVKAKYTLSLHLNSAEYKMNKGGVEIYAPSNAKLELASLLADNLVEYAKTSYSPNVTYKVEDGVYVRNYSRSEIESSAESAKSAGRKPYKLTTDTPYLFMVREPGGIATNAYVDGRNTDYGKNPYYNSNMGVESYLVELGFMNSNNDLDNILNNRNLYVEGIKQTFKNFLDL